MNARQLWDDYRERTCVEAETSHEIALQQQAFACGLIRACAGILEGEDLFEIVQGSEDLLAEACQDMLLMIDRKDRLNASEN